MAWIQSVLLLMAFLMGQTPTPETYEQALNQGLKAEGLRQWPDAVSNYVKAIKLDPNSPLPRERLISIFRELKAQGQSTTDLEILLPEEVKTQLSKLGAIETPEDQAAALKKMNYVFWSVAGFVILLIVGGLIWMFARKPQEEEEKKFSTRATPKKRAANEGGVSRNTGETKREELKITEKTREEMTGVINSVKSITASHKVTSPEELKAEVAALESSEVLNAIAQTMISDVSIEEAKEGKFSKMTIEAELIFDENDLPPDLDTYRKEHGDNGIEAYLEKLANKEAKKPS